MGYSTTGDARYKTLTINKSNDSNYPKTYDLCTGFVYNGITYSSLSDDGFSKLSDVEYEERLEAFCNYVYSLNSGLQSDCPDLTQGSTVEDYPLCRG